MKKYVVFVVDLANKKSTSDSVVGKDWKDATIKILNKLKVDEELIQIVKSEESINNIKNQFLEKEFVIEIVETFR